MRGRRTGRASCSELVAKRLALLHELVAGASRVAVLVNPADPARVESVLGDAQAAANTTALQIQVLKASTSREIDAAFATIAGQRVDALFVGPDAFFNSRRVQLALLAARYAIPAAYAVREYADAGGLMSYGNVRPASTPATSMRPYTGRSSLLS
jgi:putative ABC transport system substrate-binding protein